MFDIQLWEVSIKLSMILGADCLLVISETAVVCLHVQSIADHSEAALKLA